MTRLVSSGGPFEEVVGYSRAVAAGDQVWVSGCTSIVDGQVAHAGDPGAQATQAIAIIGAALAEVGCTLADVVRTRIYVTSAEVFPEVARAHSEIFGEIRPVNTTVIAQLMDPRWYVEIDVEAVLP